MCVRVSFGNVILVYLYIKVPIICWAVSTHWSFFLQCCATKYIYKRYWLAFCFLYPYLLENKFSVYLMSIEANNSFFVWINRFNYLYFVAPCSLKINTLLRVSYIICAYSSSKSYMHGNFFKFNMQSFTVCSFQKNWLRIYYNIYYKCFW